jgi:hypothetical protein
VTAREGAASSGSPVFGHAPAYQLALLGLALLGLALLGLALLGLALLELALLELALLELALLGFALLELALLRQGRRGRHIHEQGPLQVMQLAGVVGDRMPQAGGSGVRVEHDCGPLEPRRDLRE